MKVTPARITFGELVVHGDVVEGGVLADSNQFVTFDVDIAWNKTITIESTCLDYRKDIPRLTDCVE